MATELPGNVTQAREQASKLAGVAGEYAAGEPSVIDVLRQKVQQAYSDNKDIIEKLDAAVGGYLPSPSVGREQYQNIFNPFQRESLVSQYVANKATPMLTYSGILGNRMGRVEDLVGAGVRGYQSVSAAAQSKAQLAQQQYQNLLNEFQIKETLNKEEEAKKGQEIVEANGRKYLLSYDENGNIINKIDLGTAPTSSSGSGATIIIGGQDITDLTNNKQTQQTTYEKPPFSPYKSGIRQEWPAGSGIVWRSNSKGGWE